MDELSSKIRSKLDVADLGARDDVLWNHIGNFYLTSFAIFYVYRCT